MTAFMPFFPIPAAQPRSIRRSRLQDIDDRMTSFLSQKQVSGTSCLQVLDNIKAAKADIQHEMAKR